MPTQYDRGYDDGFNDGFDEAMFKIEQDRAIREGRSSERGRRYMTGQLRRPTRRRRRPQKPKKKRTLTAWQKFVKTNSKKKEFRLRGGKVNLKKLGVAYRKKTGKRKSKR